MSKIDWSILLGTLMIVIIYGTLKSRKNDTLQAYVLENRNTDWFTIALSVMATQLSAITILSMPGQAFHDGMGFIQFYFGLPLAVIVICIFFVPIFHRLKVYTAYEYLEKRFDKKTRTLAAIGFLIQRSIGTGITIYAPAIILHTALGWNFLLLVLLIGISITIYVYLGGAKALSITQKYQAVVMFIGILILFFYLLFHLPTETDFDNAMAIANVQDKLNILDFSFSFSERYNFWNGILGGFFIMLAYFGTDQSQVGRYISGKSLGNIQRGLVINGLFKVPIQFFILLIGVLIFIFFHFEKAPLHFNPINTQKVLNSPLRGEYEYKQMQLSYLQDEKKEIATIYSGQLNQGFNNPMLEMKLQMLHNEEKNIREDAKKIIKTVDNKAQTNDKDFVFIYYIINYLPIGLVGLSLAVIFSAALSSASAGLYAVAYTSSLDLYKSYIPNKAKTHYLQITRYSVILWGILSIVAASIINYLENLIQLVNIIGSIFYGPILGVFLLGFLVKYCKGFSVFYATIISQIFVFVLFYIDFVSYLWLVVIGTLLTIFLALLLEFVKRKYEK